jgi:beta-glucosidase
MVPDSDGARIRYGRPVTSPARTRWLSWLALAVALGAGVASVPGCAVRGASPGAGAPPARADSQPPDVEALLGRMTLDEKIGQMTQIDRNALASPSDITEFFLGSILNGGESLPVPNQPVVWADSIDAFQRAALATRLAIPILYGTDAVHGMGGVRGAVIFPHNVGLGCTRDPALVERVARTAALEVAGAGARWAFAPCIAVPRDERWGRTYEGFGETPQLASEMGPAVIRGLQQAPTSGGDADSAILACAKHFLADGGTTFGKDQGDAAISEAELRAIHLPGYAAAVKAGVGSVMVSYSSWNGVPMHANRHLITDVLKGELGFTGFVVTDWEALNKLPGDYSKQVETGINAGIDMVMVPNNYRDFITTMKELVAAGRIPLPRIDDAVRRILRQKVRFGLWAHPFADRRLTAAIGSTPHREIARQAVRESLVLLKNERRVLPLSKAARINVVGAKADDIGAQCGGWTVSWQGKRGATTVGTTILEAIRHAAADPAQVTFSGDQVGPQAARADVNVVVVGEEPYAEGRGDRNIPELTKADEALVAEVAAAGKPVVLLLLTGRPLLIGGAFRHADAVVVAWLPGSEGEGVADVLYGDARPTGKLSHTWPRELTQIPINDGDPGKDPLFPYGFGLGY